MISVANVTLCQNHTVDKSILRTIQQAMIAFNRKSN